MATSVVTPAWKDARIVRGMQKQFLRRRELLDAGEKPLGWKLAFGGPAAMERLRTNAPLVGFLLRSGLVDSGSETSVKGWTKPAAEPELAVHLGADLAAGSGRETTMRAIEGLGPAIEVADVDHPSEDVEGTLARNIYQRHVVLGACAQAYTGGKLSGLRGRVLRNEVEVADTTDLQALTGDLIDIVRHVGNLLESLGEKLRAGEIIIAGSIIPPIWVLGGEQIVFELEPMAAISVTFGG